MENLLRGQRHRTRTGGALDTMMEIMKGLSKAKKFIDGVLGADKYDRYLAHHSANHPDLDPMSEREFWKDYSDWQERNPQGRCC